MKNDERKALTDFAEWTQDTTSDMQKYVNLHRHYCRMTAIDAHVKYLYLLLHDFNDASPDDQFKFMDKMYENRDLMEENN